MSQRLKNHVAVITGGGSGIGRASAELFSAEGAKVVIGDVNDAQGEAVARDIGGVYVHTDVRRDDQVKAMFDTAVVEFGGLTICLNSAGVSESADTLWPDDPQVWQRACEVNLLGTMRCCSWGIRQLLVNGAGSVVNISSFVAVVGTETSQMGYTASKGGVVAISRELAVQYAPKRIRVNVVCPGPVNTPMLLKLFEREPERAEYWRAHIPLGRLAEPEEIARTALFLASDEASFITGATIIADGGIHSAH